jgi:deazaflavin-dependent oxidoreductase (nitroreductase family)
MGTTVTSVLPDIEPTLAATDPAAMQQFNHLLIAEFRANGGQLSGQFTGLPMLLLNTRGARSGTPCTTPIGYVRDGSSYVIMASNSGAPTHPAWFHNLLANPTATIELGRERLVVRHRIAEGDERARLSERIVAQWPMAADYARMTTRVIPVVVLERGGAQ